MSEIDRLIGRFEMFEKWERSEHGDLRTRMDAMGLDIKATKEAVNKIRVVRAFERGKLIGIMLTVSGVVTTVGFIISHLVK
jgi:hypothetical protein